MYTTLNDAINGEQSTAKLVRILDSKFCVLQTMYTDGTFSKELTVFGLHNGTLYAYGSFEHIKRWCLYVINYPYPYIKRLGQGYPKKYTRQYKRILRLTTN